MKKVCRINGINLYYEITGKGKPLLFLHGLGSSSYDWKEQVKFFSENYKVITIDLRGHGKSDKPSGDYSIKLFADDIAKFIKYLNIAPVNIIGLSMGGMIAFQLAADAPDLIESMTIVNSLPKVVLESFKEKIFVEIRYLIIRFLGLRFFSKIIGKLLLPKKEDIPIRRDIAKRFVLNDKKAYLKSFKAIIGWSAAESLNDIKIPVLIIASDKDYLPLELKKKYMKKIPNAKLVIISDAHHLVPVEKPEEFNAVLAEHLLSLCRASEQTKIL